VVREGDAKTDLEKGKTDPDASHEDTTDARPASAVSDEKKSVEEALDGGAQEPARAAAAKAEL